MHITRTAAALMVVAAFALAAAPTAVVADVEGEPVLEATLSDDRVTPGEDTTVEVTLVNRGEIREADPQNPSLTDRVKSARGATVEMKADSAPIEVQTDTQAIGTLSEGVSSPIPFDISVDEDAEPGTYRIPVTVEYTYTRIIDKQDGEETTRDREDTLYVTLVIEDDARLTVHDVTTDARVDSTGTVDVTVENTGTAAADEAALDIASPNSDLSFGGSTTASRSLGDWEPGERRTVEYTLSPDATAKPQAYSVDVTAAYRDTDGQLSESETKTVSVRPEPQQTFSVSSTDSTVAVDDTGTLTVSLQNDGPINVSKATVELTASSPSLNFEGADSTSRFVGTWQQGEIRTVEFDVTATDDADTRSYALDATVSYRDKGDDPETAPVRSLGLTPDPEQSFAISDVSSNLSVDAEGNLRGTVTNTGGTAISNGVVQFASEKDTVTPLETDAPVGGLEPGESAQFSIPLEVSESAEAGDKQYTLSVRYRNQDGDERVSDTFDVVQNVGPEQSFAISDVSANLSVGAEGTLRATVRNTGDATISNGVVQFVSEKDTVTPLETDAPVGELEPGESAQFAIPLEVSESAEAGDKQYTLSVRYRNQDGDERVSDTFDVVQNVGPDDPKFALSTNGTTVTAGETTEVEVTVTNDGTERLTDISANIFADDPVATVDDEAFISSLEPGESTVVTFSISASGGALAKDYPLSIDFQYDEPDGDTKISDTYKIPLSVQQPDSDSGPPIGLILVGVVLVVALALAYRRYR